MGEDAGLVRADLARVTTQVFVLESEYIELNQLLKLEGLCGSGGEGKQLVASGMVEVDGAIELRKTAKIRAGQRVRVGTVVISVRAE